MALHVEPGLGETPPRPDHLPAVVPVLQVLDARERRGVAPALARVGLPGTGEVQLQQRLTFCDLLPGEEPHRRNVPVDRAAHGHDPPGRELAPERDPVGDPARLDRQPAPLPGRHGGRLCCHAFEQVERACGPEAGAEEQPERQYRAQPLHHPHLAQRRRQRRVAVLDLPVGVLETAVLHLRLLRQPELRLPELAQLGDVAEHGDRCHRLGRAAGVRPPQIGGRDRERARLTTAAHPDHPPLDA